MNLLEVQLENAYLECKEIIVMGDFNVHLLSLEENFVLVGRDEPVYFKTNN